MVEQVDQMVEQVDNERETLGRKLREAREYLDLAQDEVAKILNVPRSAISLIESGQRKVEALELKRLAELYQRSVNSFTGDEGQDANLPDEVEHLARAATELSKEDRDELVRFAAFLRSRSKNESAS